MKPYQIVFTILGDADADDYLCDRMRVYDHSISKILRCLNSSGGKPVSEYLIPTFSIEVSGYNLDDLQYRA